MNTQTPYLCHDHLHLSPIFSQRKLLKFFEPVEKVSFTQNGLTVTSPQKQPKLGVEAQTSWFAFADEDSPSASPAATTSLVYRSSMITFISSPKDNSKQGASRRGPSMGQRNRVPFWRCMQNKGKGLNELTTILVTREMSSRKLLRFLRDTGGV